MPKLKVQGKRVDAVDDRIQTGLRTNGLQVERVMAVELGAVRGVGEAQTADVADDAVLVLHLDGGFKLFSRYDDFRNDFPQTAVRDIEPGAFLIEPSLGIAAADRTIGTLALQALEIFDIKPDEQTALGLAQKFEKQLEREPGLYRMKLAPAFDLSEAPAAPAPGKAALIFVHGTASSSRGSYKSLSFDAPGAEIDFAGQIQTRYGENIFAYEHRSLTESPVTNALNLAKLLPEDAIVHLVSHSRGGLIGDLLSIGQLEGASALDARAVSEFFRNRDEERGQIAELQAVLGQKKVRIERFVRVASPARGTTLASGRADRWFSILLSLIGQLPFLQDPLVSKLYEALQDFLLAVAKKRMDPNVLPGIEAMMPSSPVVRLLNVATVKSTADLSVIAGDTQGKGILGKLKLFLPDRFYGGRHDLVVNTASMDGGLARTRARLFLDSGSDVNHFHYFLNKNTKKLILAGLTRADNDNAGYGDFERKQVSIPERGVQVASGPRPAVFLIPGIMGSNLAVNGSRVWIDYPGLFFGDTEKIKIGATGVQADSIFIDFYSRLIDYLSATHEVIAFPYDWRLSLRIEAKRLAGRVSEKLDSAERAGQPVRILGHSMGGLLARVMIAQAPEVWARIVHQPGGRLVMLGTPNSGSHEMLRLLTGHSRIVRQLELVDSRHKPGEIREMFAQYPGLLEMLPRQQSLDFFDPAVWDVLRKIDGTLPLPSKTDLLDAAKTRALLDSLPFDADHMVYVAGSALQTPSELFTGGGQIQFRATNQGDGKVTWNTTLAVPTYYSTAEHGDLANLPAEFAAIADLLQGGTTTRLPKEPPAGARAPVAAFELPPDPIEMLPDERAIRAATLGASIIEKHEPPVQLIRVSVTHGDLAFARYTIAVGHYEGDSIVGAEGHLDRHLDGRLTRWNQLGVYPSKLGSSEVFLGADPKCRPSGAIIVGLGRVGELRPKELESSYYNAALQFGLSVADCPDDRFRDSDGVLQANITSLLIGTMGDAVTVEECVTAILRAVKAANAALERYGNTVRINEVEFLDLWEDRAIQAARALTRAAADPELRAVIEIKPLVDLRDGGLRRLVASDNDEWWNRLRITSDKKTDALRFAVITDRARTEVELVAQERALVDQFIGRAIGSSKSDAGLASTLFEMLVPNRLKEFAPVLQRTVVLVDKESARYPWELLEDRLGRRQRPISVDCGFVRQLETEDFREVVVHGYEQTALVVGNPQTTKFLDLPGAEREAKDVAKTLEGMEVKVTPRIAGDPVSIMTDLHAAPYRILHLAGHGVHDYQPAAASGSAVKKPVSGMVIGDDVFLTASMIGQMRRVPELVFINCCHLGRTDDKSRSDTRRDDRHRLAANLAVEFINMGVKAVIAAGWAVDDAAASTFATRFYGYFLSGDGFGDAVQKARRDTYQGHPGVNTWGAYQCYGDPDFRFKREAAERPSSAVDKSFAMPSQFLVELDNLTRQAQVASGEKIKSLRAEAEQVLQAANKSWINRGDVLYALGCLYGELGDYDQAVSYYERAAKQEKASGMLRGIEQEANMRARAAVRKWATKQISSKEACDAIDSAIEKIEIVLKLGATKERLGIKASTYKRRALVDDNLETRRQSLEKMTEAYKEAFDLAGADSLYSSLLTNWLVSATVVRWADPTAKDILSEYKTHLDAYVVQGAEKARVDPSFWNAVIVPDCTMIRYLANPARTDAAIREISVSYRKARDEGEANAKCSPCWNIWSFSSPWRVRLANRTIRWLPRWSVAGNISKVRSRCGLARHNKLKIAPMQQPMVPRSHTGKFGGCRVKLASR